MENNDELKEIDITKSTCYFVNDIIEIRDFDSHISLNEKSYKGILVYDISCKNLIGAKPLRTRFDKVDGAYDGTRYLVLFGLEKYDAICNRIRYLIGQKSGITYIISHNYPKIKIDSCNSLPLEKNIDLA